MADTDPTQTTGAATPPQTQTTAATQIVRIAEAELPTATAAQIAEIRVIDTQGNSKTMTLDEARKALALSHSLTEQLVPGEFWIDAYGDSSQVYQRTFTGVFPSGQTMVLLTAVRDVFLIRGDISGFSPSVTISRVLDINGFNWYYKAESSGNLYIYPYNVTSNYLGGERYNFTFKYTKL